MKRKSMFLQIFLCFLLLVFCIIMRFSSERDAVAAGAFGKSRLQNLTFEDYITNRYGDLF